MDVFIFSVVGLWLVVFVDGEYWVFVEVLDGDNGIFGDG